MAVEIGVCDVGVFCRPSGTRSPTLGLPSTYVLGYIVRPLRGWGGVVRFVAFCGWAVLKVAGVEH